MGAPERIYTGVFPGGGASTVHNTDRARVAQQFGGKENVVEYVRVDLVADLIDKAYEAGINGDYRL